MAAILWPIFYMGFVIDLLHSHRDFWNHVGDLIDVGDGCWRGFMLTLSALSFMLD